MSISSEDAQNLIARARDGSGSSLGRLLDSYRDYLMQIAGQRIRSDLRPKMSSSDVVQGSLLVATREFTKFRGTTEQEMRSWLLKILASQFADGLRRFVLAEKRRLDREVDHGDSHVRKASGQEPGPGQAISDQEQALKLWQAISDLPAELHEVVRGRYLDGLTFPQLADRLKIPVTTCRRRWLEAVQAIGTKMDVEGMDS